ncbi:MAG: hypothetical protein R2789_08400 [Microthrixaceae bacterium]
MPDSCVSAGRRYSSCPAEAVAMFMGWLRRQRIASETVTADEAAGDGSPDTDQDDAAET